jgi:hypothetical protein
LFLAATAACAATTSTYTARLVIAFQAHGSGGASVRQTLMSLLTF